MASNKSRAVDAANRALKRGQIGKAIAEYQRLVRQDPNDIRSKLKLGDLFIRAGQRDAAIEILKSVADFYSRQGFTLKAVAVYKQILRINPALSDANVALAKLYQQQGRLSDAVRHFRQAARLFADRGKTLERLEVIRQLVDLDPENVADRVRLAEAFSSSQRFPEAVALFRQALETLQRHDRPRLYCKVAERLLHHQPDDFEVNRRLADCYLRERDAQRALPKLRACYRQQPRDMEVLEMLQETFDLLGQPHKAVTVLREMARLYEESGLLKERNQIYERILLIDEADSEARRALRVKTAVGPDQIVVQFDDSRPGVVASEVEEAVFDTPEDTEPVSLEELARAADAARDERTAVAARPRAQVSQEVPPKPADDIEVEELLEAVIDEDAEVSSGDLEIEPIIEETDEATVVQELPIRSGTVEMPQSRPVEEVAEAAPTPRPNSTEEALAAVRSGDPSVEALFEDLDLEEEIDIQDEADDTVVVGDLDLEDFEDFELDDGLSSSAGGEGSSAPAVGDADWDTLLTGDAESAASEDDVDLDALLAEADRAVAAIAEPESAPVGGADTTQQLREALEEVDFYIANQLTSDASQLLGELHKAHPNHPEILRRLEQIRK